MADMIKANNERICRKEDRADAHIVLETEKMPQLGRPLKAIKASPKPGEASLKATKSWLKGTKARLKAIEASLKAKEGWIRSNLVAWFLQMKAPFPAVRMSNLGHLCLQRRL